MVISLRCIIEPIAIYLTAELLGLIELIHAMRIVHADIKPDNFLLCHTPSSARYLLQTLPRLTAIAIIRRIENLIIFHMDPGTL